MTTKVNNSTPRIAVVLKLPKGAYNVALNLLLWVWRYLMNHIRASLYKHIHPKPADFETDSDKLYYHIDSFEDTGFMLSIRGWIFLTKSEIQSAAFALRQDGKIFEYPMDISLSRPDVLKILPYSNALKSGFSACFYPEIQGKLSAFIKLTLTDGTRKIVEMKGNKFELNMLGKIAHRIIENRKHLFTTTASKTNKINIYISSCGNYFFKEIADLILLGIRSAGYTAELLDEKNGFASKGDWHIIVAPHEFFSLGNGTRLAKSKIPGKLILFNTEQPASPWFKITSGFLKYAFAIWDMEYSSALNLKEKLKYVEYFPLGFHPAFKPFCEPVFLKDHAGTLFFPAAIKHGNYQNSRFNERPIDIFFIGFASLRRQEFFARNAAIFAKYRCYFHFSNEKKPVIPGDNSFMDTETVTGLLQRSKIVLNIHHGTDAYFEWHRIVLQGIWQKALVISENCGLAPPFSAGIDYIQDDLNALAARCEYYLSSIAGQEKAQQIIDNATNTLFEKCRISITAKTLIENLEIP